MNADQVRTSLDSMLARAGQTVTLQRLLGTQLTPVSVTLRAHIADFKPAEMISGSGIQTGDSHAIISTTEIDAAQWPGAMPPAQQTPGDPRVPRKGDRLIVQGKVRAVVAAWEAPRINGELVRIEMQIR